MKIYSTKRYRIAPECGTKAGYDYHTRQLKEQPCVLCRASASQHWREQRQKRKAEINAKRRVWQKSQPSRKKFPKEIVIAMYGTKCHICNLEIDLSASSIVGAAGWELSYHPDHLIPRSRGGADNLDNIRPSHAYCNQRKWASSEQK